MIYSSNHLEYLCKKLADNTLKPEGGVFDREIIITGSAGTTAWLKTELAKINGVIANVSFMDQDSFLEELFKNLTGEKLRNNRDIIRFNLYSLLNSSEFKSKFPIVAKYFEDRDIHRIQLAGKVAGLFDQYQLYNNDIIKSWEEDTLVTGNSETEEWQKWLWNGLKIESRETTKNKVIEAINENKTIISKTWPRISLFGITSFTGFHLEFFRKLSEVTIVNIYLNFPSPKIPFKNDLLESFGSNTEESIELVNGKFGSFDFTSIINSDATTLGKLQNQILDNVNGDVFDDDDSVQINSCYTPAREAECLYNYLLGLFDNDRSLRPGDVLVITTDISKYAPFIKAVFRNAPVKVPFRISGEPCNSDGSIIASIEQILRFTEPDFTSEKVISLLEKKRIKKRFGFSDCNYIRSVIRQANIRFGRENNTEDDTVYVSWKYGLEKILLGCAMLTDEEYPVENGLTLFPFLDAEGSNSNSLLRLIAFFQRLELVVDERLKPRTMADWKEFLFGEIVENMIYYDDFVKDDRAELASVYRALSYIELLEFDHVVPYEVFLEELDLKLFTESREMKLNTGNVTVSSPAPVQGIPFKIICFLGLDNDIFPRRDQFMGFDLLGEGTCPSDRSKREMDKQLFLDTLLSARENLYLSYAGQSVKDNTEIPPSVVIDTLTSYLGEGVVEVKHPLHGFSSSYNQPGNERMINYLYGQRGGEYSIAKKNVEEIKDIQIKSLLDFVRDPLKWFFNHVLDISYDENDYMIDETEIFELNNLQKWKIKKKLLTLEDGEISNWIEKGKKEGYLPLKTAATASVEQLRKEMEDIIPVYKKLIDGQPEESHELNLMIDNVVLSGTIDGVYGDRLISYSVSDYPLKYKAEAYVKALLLSAGNIIKSATFVDKQGAVTSIPADPSSAINDLSELLEYFNKSHLNPMLFTFRSAKKAKCLIGMDDYDDNKINNVIKEFETDKYCPYLKVLIKENILEGFGKNEIGNILDFSKKLKIFEF